MALELNNLLAKTNTYKEVLGNTIKYRAEWHSNLKPMLKSTLEEILEKIEITGDIKIQDKIQNLESLSLDLGRTTSGISENVDNSGVQRTMIKTNGALIYQQLFNGKIMVMIVGPFIEGYGEQKGPRTLEILRPEELSKPSIVKHIEILFKEIIAWEDFDDNEPNKAANSFNPIGFNRDEVIEAP